MTESWTWELIRSTSGCRESPLGSPPATGSNRSECSRTRSIGDSWERARRGARSLGGRPLEGESRSAPRRTGASPGAGGRATAHGPRCTRPSAAIPAGSRSRPGRRSGPATAEEVTRTSPRYVEATYARFFDEPTLVVDGAGRWSRQPGGDGLAVSHRLLGGFGTSRSVPTLPASSVAS